MRPNSLRRATIIAFYSGCCLQVGAVNSDVPWLAPKMEGVTAAAQADGSWLVTSTVNGEYSIESSQGLPATHGDSFAIKVSVQVGVDMNALPELVCYDAAGSEIPIPSSLLHGNRYAT